MKKRTFAQQEEATDKAEEDKRRWVCQRCGAVHHAPFKKCGRCDSEFIKELDPTNFGGIGEGDVGWRARRLARLCDIYSMRAVDVVLRPKLLAEAGLEDVPLPEAVVIEAQRLDREAAQAIRDRVERINALLAPARSVPTRQESVKELLSNSMHSKAPGEKRSKIYGYPVTAVIRWMGKREWDVKESVRVLKALGVDMAISTVRIQLRAGAVGDKTRGEPAALTPDQIKELNAI